MRIAKRASALLAAAQASRQIVALARGDRSELRQALRGLSPATVLKQAGKGSAMGIGAILALPVFGAVGAITATGVVVGVAAGAIAGLAEEVAASRQRDAAARREAGADQ